MKTRFEAQAEQLRYARRALENIAAGVQPSSFATLAIKHIWCTEPSAPPAPSYQNRVLAWLLACFGPASTYDAKTRIRRFLEESLELVQACGGTDDEAHQLVDYVFGRPVGEKGQEVGGVLSTLSSLCGVYEIDMMQAAERELARVWTKIDVIRVKEASKPTFLPLPGVTINSQSECLATFGNSDSYQPDVPTVAEEAQAALNQPLMIGDVKWPHPITVANITQLIREHARDAGNHLGAGLDASGSYLVQVAASFKWCLEQIANSRNELVAEGQRMINQDAFISDLCYETPCLELAVTRQAVAVKPMPTDKLAPRAAYEKWRTHGMREGAAKGLAMKNPDGSYQVTSIEQQFQSWYAGVEYARGQKKGSTVVQPKPAPVIPPWVSMADAELITLCSTLAASDGSVESLKEHRHQMARFINAKIEAALKTPGVSLS